MNSFGTALRLTLFGESHGPQVGIVIDGIPAGTPLSEEDLLPDLARRRGGSSIGSTPRTEQDRPAIVSGLLNGRTTGAPVTLLFANSNLRPQDYDALRNHCRPSHADMTAAAKYGGYNDPRGGGMFSGRMTVALVAAGAIAKKLLPGITFTTRLTEIGGTADPDRFDELLADLRRRGDSAGGIVEVAAQGVTRGTGEPFFDSVESVAAHLLFAIPGIKGV